MAFTLGTYICLLLFCLATIYLYKNSKNKYRDLWLWLTIIVYSIVIGCRYDVGIDYKAYKFWFEYDMNDIEMTMETDWLKSFLKFLGLGYPSFFITMAAVQIGFFLSSFKTRPQIIVWGIFFFFTTLQFFISMNVVRQVASWCIFLYSIQYIQNKRFIQYILCIFGAMLFHKSAIVLLPLYFVPTNITLNRNILFLVYLLLFTVGTVLQDRITSIMSTVALFIGYDQYSESLQQLMENVNFGSESSMGIMKYVWLILNSMAIYYYPILRERFRKQGFSIIFILYLLGILLDCIVGGTILDRATMYFLPFRIIIYSYMFYYLSSFCKSRYKYVAVSGCTLVMLVFYIYSGIFGNASGCTPFQFI